MKQVQIKRYSISMFGSEFQIAFANRTEVEGGFYSLHREDSCRTYLSNYLFEIDKSYHDLNILADSLNLERIGPSYSLAGPLSTEETILFVATNNPLIKKSFDVLNDWCARANVNKTKVYSAYSEGKQIGYIFIGDKAWQSNLWKLTIFSYLIKKSVVNVTEYDFELARYENQFIHKVNTLFKEVLHSSDITDLWGAIHEYSGFVSISRGINKVMLALILEEPR